MEDEVEFIGDEPDVLCQLFAALRRRGWDSDDALRYVTNVPVYVVRQDLEECRRELNGTP